MIHLRLCHRHTSHTVCRLVPVLGGSLIRSGNIHFFNVSAPKSWRPSPGLIRSDKTGSSLMSHYSVVKEPKDKDIPSTIQAEKNAFFGTCFLNFLNYFFRLFLYCNIRLPMVFSLIFNRMDKSLISVQPRINKYKRFLSISSPVSHSFFKTSF